MQKKTITNQTKDTKKTVRTTTYKSKQKTKISPQNKIKKNSKELLQSSNKNSAIDSNIIVQHLTVAYNKRPVLWDIDVTIPKGNLVAIVGPNGAGKSTFLQAMLKIVPSISGNISFFGKSLKQYRKSISYIPQRKYIDWDFPINVIELVTMGVYKKVGWFSSIPKIYKEQIRQSLKKVGMLSYAERQISQLSGGQQQRVFMARALVENSDVYCMDEPFAGVDATTEKAILNILKELRKQKKTIIVVHHNLNTVSQYFNYAILLNLNLVAAGKVSDVFTEKNLIRTYRGRLTLLDTAAREVIQKQ